MPARHLRRSGARRIKQLAQMLPADLRLLFMNVVFGAVPKTARMGGLAGFILGFSEGEDWLKHSIRCQVASRVAARVCLRPACLPRSACVGSFASLD